MRDTFELTFVQGSKITALCAKKQEQLSEAISALCEA